MLCENPELAREHRSPNYHTKHVVRPKSDLQTRRQCIGSSRHAKLSRKPRNLGVYRPRNPANESARGACGTQRHSVLAGGNGRGPVQRRRRRRWRRMRIRNGHGHRRGNILRHRWQTQRITATDTTALCERDPRSRDPAPRQPGNSRGIGFTPPPADGQTPQSPLVCLASKTKKEKMHPRPRKDGHSGLRLHACVEIHMNWNLTLAEAMEMADHPGCGEERWCTTSISIELSNKKVTGPSNSATP